MCTYVRTYLYIAYKLVELTSFNLSWAVFHYVSTSLWNCPAEVVWRITVTVGGECQGFRWHMPLLLTWSHSGSSYIPSLVAPVPSTIDLMLLILWIIPGIPRTCINGLAHHYKSWSLSSSMYSYWTHHWSNILLHLKHGQYMHMHIDFTVHVHCMQKFSLVFDSFFLWIHE